MYQGENRTAQKSQEWFVGALKQLMAEKQYEKISIMDICKKADLSRQTFYNLFESKEDVLRFCLRQHYTALYENTLKKESIEIEDTVHAFAEELEIDKEIIQMMLDSGLESVISDEIARCVELFANRLSSRERNDVSLPYGKAFVGGALSRILIYWFKDSERVSPDELVSIILSFFSGTYFGSLMRAQPHFLPNRAT